jgi:CBS domain-containing protein
MTTAVACAHEDTPFKELAAIMVSRGIGALPVLDEQGRVAGVVSEADLLRKEEYQEDGAKRVARWWHRADRAKAAGVIARDLMTSPAITIGPDATVVEAARSLGAHHIERLPVVDAANQLAGICSQRDLLQVFLRPDEQIRAEVRGDVFGAFLATNLALVHVDVARGVVTLGGEVGSKSMIPLAVQLTHAVDGVVDVVDELTFAVDDATLPMCSSLSGVRNARFIPPEPGGHMAAWTGPHDGVGGDLDDEVQRHSL